jgi:hypothetical protein
VTAVADVRGVARAKQRAADADAHSGGVWKLFDRTRTVRQTVDELLRPIAE